MFKKIIFIFFICLINPINIFSMRMGIEIPENQNEGNIIIGYNAQVDNAGNENVFVGQQIAPMQARENVRIGQRSRMLNCKLVSKILFFGFMARTVYKLFHGKV